MKNYSKNNIFYALVFISISIASCRTTHNAPFMTSVPFIDEEKELVVSAGIDGMSFLGVQGAYGLTDKYAVQLSGMYQLEEKEYFKGRLNAYLIDAGFGWYKNFKGPAMIDVYAGIGHGYLGRGVSLGWFDVNDYSVGINRLYIQPTAALTYNVFDIGFSPRLVFSDFYTEGVDYSNYSEEAGNSIRTLNSRVYPFFEPTLTARLGYKYVKLQAQVSGLVKMTSAPINFIDENFSLSVVFNLPHDRFQSKVVE